MSATLSIAPAPVLRRLSFLDRYLNSLANRPSVRRSRGKSVDSSRVGGGRGPVAPPVFKTGLAANIVAGGFDSLPPPPLFPRAAWSRGSAAVERLGPAQTSTAP